MPRLDVATPATVLLLQVWGRASTHRAERLVLWPRSARAGEEVQGSARGRGTPEPKAAHTISSSPDGHVRQAPTDRFRRSTRQHLAHFVALERIGPFRGAAEGHGSKGIAGPAQPASSRLCAAGIYTPPSPAGIRGSSASSRCLQWEPREYWVPVFVFAVRHRTTGRLRRSPLEGRRASRHEGHATAAPSNPGLQRTRCARR
jgi:hypothetical protein